MSTTPAPTSVGLKHSTRILPGLIAMALWLTSSPTCHGFQKGNSLLQELGRAIGNALGGRDPAPGRNMAAPEAVIMPPQEVPARPEKDVEEFTQRMHGYSQVLQGWIATVTEMSDVQKQQLRLLIDKQLVESKKRFAGNSSGQDGNHVFPEVFPVHFTLQNQNRPATNFADSILKTVQSEILRPEQIAALQAAIEERRQFQLRAVAEYLAAEIDAELFLTTGQRQQVIESLLSVKPPVSHSLYAFQVQSYYLPYESLGNLTTRSGINRLLDDHQHHRLRDLTDSDGSGHIVFQAATGVEEWNRQLLEMSVRQRDQYLRAAKVRVSCYERELRLTSDESQYLTTAGKGAAVTALMDWKESTRQRFDQMQEQMAQFGGNFGFGAGTINTQGIDQNPIWTRALTSLGEERVRVVMETRSEAIRSGLAMCLVAMLDEELWLLPPQRDMLHKLSAQFARGSSESTQYQEYIGHIILLAYPLFLIPESDISEALSENQQQVWKSLRGFYNIREQDNYVQIPLRNQGGSFGFMLRK